MLYSRGYCTRCQRSLVQVGLYFRCLGCGEGVSLQALRRAVLMNQPLPPKPTINADGYVEGEQWVNVTTHHRPTGFWRFR